MIYDANGCVKAWLIYQVILFVGNLKDAVQAANSVQFVARDGERFLPAVVEHMLNSGDWVVPKHPGAGITHDGSDFFSHRRVKAVDGALRTGGFAFLIRALYQPPSGVIYQLETLRTQMPRGVVFPAKEFYHRHYGPAFSFQSRRHNSFLF